MLKVIRLWATENYSSQIDRELTKKMEQEIKYKQVKFFAFQEHELWEPRWRHLPKKIWWIIRWSWWPNSKTKEYKYPLRQHMIHTEFLFLVEEQNSY